MAANRKGRGRRRRTQAQVVREERRAYLVRSLLELEDDIATAQSESAWTALTQLRRLQDVQQAELARIVESKARAERARDVPDREHHLVAELERLADLRERAASQESWVAAATLSSQLSERHAELTALRAAQADAAELGADELVHNLVVALRTLPMSVREAVLASVH